MYILIALATMTNLGTFPTQERCQTAIRHIYEQKLDPYQMMNQTSLKKVVELQMKYTAPKEFRCQKV